MPDGTTYAAYHFGIRSRVVSRLSRALDGLTYTQRHGIIAGMRRRGGLGFLPAWVAGREGDTAEIRFLRALDMRGQVVYDVGAFHGILTLHFARTARQVIAFEPNPVSRARLQDNLTLNALTNVRVVPLACGREAGMLELFFDPAFSGGASADAALKAQIAGSTRERRMQRASVPVLRLDDVVVREGLPAPDLVKIDVEGLELDVLEGMETLLAREQPRLYLEMHGSSAEDKTARVRKIVEFLVARRYVVRHVESGTFVTVENAGHAREGHLYCEPARH
jgi:FkbM family methyltransferase